MTTLPLDGIRVIDFTQVMLGPSCTQVLADYGAEVIKIEKVKIGDLSRWSLGSDPDGLNNPVFCSLNRNKKSLALDLKEANARKTVQALLETADVVVNNFRPGVMERMGFGYEDLKTINPRLIYAVGTGFGLTGPYQHKGGQDVLAQAVSGVMRRKSDNSHPTSIYATPLADYSAGMHLVQGILLALLQRDKTGEGQQVAVSLYNSMIAMQMQEGTTHLMRQKDLNWGAFPLTGVFETTDSAIVMVGAFKPNPLRDICEALEIEDLSQYPQYKDFDAQMARRPELQAIFRENFAKNSTAHWIARLEGVDILCAPVRSLPEALKDEQTIINKMILEAGETAAGPIRLIGSPIDMSAAQVTVRISPPRLGQHNEEILASLSEVQGDAA
ncbi:MULTISPECIES: CaiB/BaiF CoA-transferase family protein [unclassified Rhizobium]|jgi:crotonobetainyl-CoA:carnitine CoA-transferase CaiB-like acyl-CoA transferase|uniref:CaiB/BaiF CoA transferase family protein n=1 Tax=unclassified Rhizobium TaxID=2613769 RepID=UPI000647F965|nr:MULTISPECIES: CaiB/BaiF CoA-transferase family protein [unclassified Rhizobium]MBN8953004.1 CoA transferase [Rhizobium tropici]OJY64666.1 MAG: formyl-CoA transferase [Rhizobium sp. 60-20]RKD72470.1 formyl-CoA transferase [Rhizobium sp. WW_1]